MEEQLLPQHSLTAVKQLQPKLECLQPQSFVPAGRVAATVLHAK
jgi:hypothetical protein